MGYSHYWHRPDVIDQPTFDAIRVDFERLILPLHDAGIELAGGLGEGPPEINDHIIRFNGMDECGHLRNDDISIPYPSEFAHGIGPSTTALEDDSDGYFILLKHRCCNGRCAYETFGLPRCMNTKWRCEPDENGLYTGWVKTGFRPYDIAVTAALIVAKRHLKDRFLIYSNGGDPQWVDAKRMCQSVLGYGDWFGIMEEKISEEWPGSPTEEREVLVRTLIELNPATLI